MSDFTIDIQLTELGFPDILQPREMTCVKETPSPSASNNISPGSLANLQTPSSSPPPAAALTPTAVDPELVGVEQLVSVASRTASTVQQVASQTGPRITVTPSPSGPPETLTILCPPPPSTHKPVVVAHTSRPVSPILLPKSLVSGQSNSLHQIPKITKTVMISVSRVGAGTVLTTVPATSTPPVEHLRTIKKDSELPLADQTAMFQTTPKLVNTGKPGRAVAEEEEPGENIGEGIGGRNGGKGVFDDGKVQGLKEKEAEVAKSLEEDSEETDDSEVSENEDDDEEEEEEDELDPEAEPGGSGEHRCSVCDLVLSSSFQLQEHMNLHTGARPYCCAECGKRFCQLTNYRSHLRTHAQPQTSVPPVQLRCRVCLKGFDSEQGLKDHLAKSHFEKEFYECDACKRIFTCLTKCEEHLEEHKRELADHVCLQCCRRFRLRRSLRRHKERGCVRSYRCTDCPMNFSRKNALLKHSFSHLGLLPYTCIQCRAHFRLARLYRKHECEPERLHCVACLGVFQSHNDFQRHKRETGCWGQQGTKGDEIRCMECGHAFSTTDELKNHAGAHQRVMTCSECGKGFRSALMLMSHMGGHAGSRPCLCKNCGLGFPHQQGYESHLKDCGRKPPPVMAPKKPRKDAPATSKPLSQLAPSYLPVSPPVKKLERQASAPLSTPVRMPGSAPAGVTMGIPNTTAVRAVSPDQPTKGLWKLSLDKQPPPGVSLVMFVPANTPLASGLSGPSSTSQLPALSGTQPQWKVFNPAPNPGAPPPVLCQSSFTSEPGLSLIAEANRRYSSDAPLDLALKTTYYEQEPANLLPLDLSNKSTCSTPPANLVVKTEPRDPGFAEETEEEVFTSLTGDRKGIGFQSKREPGGDSKMETMAQKGGNREGSGDEDRQTDNRDDGTAQTQMKKAPKPGVPSTLRLLTVKQTEPLKNTAKVDLVNQLKIESVSSLHSKMLRGFVHIKQEPLSLEPDSGTQSSNFCSYSPLTALKRKVEPDVGLDLRWDGGTPGCVLDLRLKGGNPARCDMAEKAEERNMEGDRVEEGLDGGENDGATEERNIEGDRVEEGLDGGENDGATEERKADMDGLEERKEQKEKNGTEERKGEEDGTEETDAPVDEPTAHNPETQLPSSLIPSPPSSPPCKRRRSLRTREKPRALRDCLL
ncbi:zinc finger protein 341-like [Oncorhynchus keta]|uniref:zinc finger protein 341-like n=1 Tax=Oncorhynchus keta TaxID=8018 RepID=UPI00227CDEBF|nr:zinc finger protein 341-like [Oncorhynchus keta]XP_052350666.1 zinc finger protein 341-like [Oncorhynchus keta]